MTNDGLKSVTNDKIHLTENRACIRKKNWHVKGDKNDKKAITKNTIPLMFYVLDLFSHLQQCLLLYMSNSHVVIYLAFSARNDPISVYYQ